MVAVQALPRKKNLEKPTSTQIGLWKFGKNLGNPCLMEDNKGQPSAAPQRGGTLRAPPLLVLLSLIWQGLPKFFYLRAPPPAAGPPFEGFRLATTTTTKTTMNNNDNDNGDQASKINF